MRHIDKRVLLGVGLILVLHVTLAWRSTAQRSLTMDEIFHLTGGYLFNRFGDYRLHMENGVLPQRLHALPAILMGAKPPRFEGNEDWRRPNLYAISNQFLHESGNDSWRMLMAARAMNLLFSVAICGLVFVWAHGLAGALAGFAALILAAFSPTLLAHGPLATTDAAAGFFLPASAGAFWWQLRQPTKRRTLLSAGLFGLACVAKYSAVLLVPVFALLVGVHFFLGRSAQVRDVVASLGAHGLIAWLIIWMFFGFRYSAFSPATPPAEHFVVTWDYVISRAGWQGEVIHWLKDTRLLPEGFLFGYLHTYVGSLQRGCFLAGEYGVTGWRSFFPLAFLWKSTPAELGVVVACLIGAALRWSRLRTICAAGAPLVVLGLVYGAVAITSHLNIGHRHLLPIYPLVFVAGGVAIAAFRRAPLLLASLFAGSQFFSAAGIQPYPLAYFNALAGGPANGWRLLVDSSLDWGQDLPTLKRWLDTHDEGPNTKPVFLSYFGSAEPRSYGIDARLFFLMPPFKENEWHALSPGIYCISATNLQEVYSPVRGAWTLEFEREYQTFRALDAEFLQYFGNPSSRAALLARAPAEAWERGRKRYEWLRHARLSAYLRARGPDATAGYSIFIFRLSETDLNTALHSPYSEWLNFLEKSASRGR